MACLLLNLALCLVFPIRNRLAAYFDFPRFFNLYNDPKEEYPLTTATAGHFWVRWPIGEVLTAHLESLEREPPIRPGTPDPYQPPRP